MYLQTHAHQPGSCFQEGEEFAQPKQTGNEGRRDLKQTPKHQWKFGGAVQKQDDG